MIVCLCVDSLLLLLLAFALTKLMDFSMQNKYLKLITNLIYTCDIDFYFFVCHVIIIFVILSFDSNKVTADYSPFIEQVLLGETFRIETFECKYFEWKYLIL